MSENAAELQTRDFELNGTMEYKVRVVLAGALGNVREWYDFGLYGLLAPVLASLFFPGHDRIAALLGVYAGFAIGFVMRPALALGHLADRVGRRWVLALSVLLMGLSTVAAGLLPTYRSWTHRGGTGTAHQCRGANVGAFRGAAVGLAIRPRLDAENGAGRRFWCGGDGVVEGVPVGRQQRRGGVVDCATRVRIFAGDGDGMSSSDVVGAICECVSRKCARRHV
jgi:hypothetical protein